MHTVWFLYANLFANRKSLTFKPFEYVTLKGFFLTTLSIVGVLNLSD
jgi:hypothetical protein